MPTQEESQSEGDSDNDEVHEISKWASIIWLFILTAWISFLSEYLVDAIEVPISSQYMPDSVV